MTDDKIERMLHVVLNKLNRLEQGQSNHARLLASIEDHLGHLMPLDVTGEASIPPPPFIDDSLLASASSEDRARSRTHLQAIRGTRATA